MAASLDLWNLIESQLPQSYFQSYKGYAVFLKEKVTRRASAFLAFFFKRAMHCSCICMVVVTVVDAFLINSL